MTGVPTGLEEARRLLSGARRVVILTGAGISAESGVPTFRGDGGLWKSHRPQELATPQAFQRDPRLVWEWYQWRRDLISGCAPNAGHRALARFALARHEHGSWRTALVTQNVDGLHEVAAEEEAAALSDASRVSDPSPALPLELHGALFRNRCSACGRRSGGREAVDATSEETLPRCSACSGMLRPDVVWFGESLDPEVISTAFERARAADVCLVVGTSAVVHPAASVPLATLEGGGELVEVNPEATPLTRHAAVALRGPSGEILPALLG